MRRLSTSPVGSVADLGPPRVQVRDLEETGRLHFFYHSPDSALPVRDVLDKHGKGEKKEPHLEQMAENYCVPCLQNNIRGFLKSNEKYLFLFTRRSDCKEDKERYVVGYLTKQRSLLRSHLNENGKIEHHWAVQGPIRLFSFDQAFALEDLTGVTESAAAHLRFKKLDNEQTNQLLEQFKTGKDIFRKCLREVQRLKRKLTSRRRDATGCSHTRRC